jgi:hypothetical protein
VEFLNGAVDIDEVAARG